MTTSDDMHAQIRSLEANFDRLEKKVDQLPTRADWLGFASKDDLSKFASKDDLSKFATKDDLSRFATKDDLSKFATKDDLSELRAELSRFATRDDLVVFKDEIIKNFRILAEDAKDSAKKAAEGYGATLDRIERDLGDMNRQMGEKFSDHDRVLATHNDRLLTLEARRRR